MYIFLRKQQNTHTRTHTHTRAIRTAKPTLFLWRAGILEIANYVRTKKTNGLSWVETIKQNSLPYLYKITRIDMFVLASY